MSGAAANPRSRCERSSPSPPGWLLPLSAPSPARALEQGKLRIEFQEREHLSLIRICAPNAGALNSDDFRDIVRGCYMNAGDIIRKGHSHPIRFWNYVPGISRISPSGLSGYEVFNGGRYEAFRQWYEELASEHLAVASAVGAPNEDFSLHVLTSSLPAVPVDNPRQIAPHRYSKLYGPLPPVFARGCRLSQAQQDVLRCSALVAGTASIVGEDTRHQGNLALQLGQVYLNLATLSNVLAEKEADSDRDALARYSALRVYVVDPEDDASVLAWLRGVFPHISSPELVRADLCRSDLLVEIEGTLSFPA